MNRIIANYILTTVTHARRRRAIESRAFARAVSKRFHTSIYRVYGIIGWLTRSSQLTFVVRKAGGLSYFR